ncbi:hypothetical protein W97_07884 [Coniosporium apollinis CBS 100218]|uniref:N-acetyltransferase domain-containing protein n=1 Tax=Coniosporium apollinis (strain CBS 100218) TaxID=1168221 RepID=R7Z402_CONA1|nr:uncharacterized protein W97_07884 [Coniosporium apollinis CBS 100218]EON68626.1 hypothetical protein W97_07884 [Coniosporium apollinis CBS 100218]
MHSHLHLSRASPSDLDEIITAQYTSFAGLDAHDALFGPDTPSARAIARKKFLKDMRHDAADVWMKIVDKRTGRIVSAANWKVYPNWGGSGVKDEDGVGKGGGKDPAQITNGDSALVVAAPAPAMEMYEVGSVEREAAEDAMRDFVERRKRYMDGEGHVLLNILFTVPAYQRHGCGAMMVKWGTELADQLSVPAWVEGSPAGWRLYDTHGFEELEKIAKKTKKWTVVYYMMRRKARPLSLDDRDAA